MNRSDPRVDAREVRKAWLRGRVAARRGRGLFYAGRYCWAYLDGAAGRPCPSPSNRFNQGD